MQGSALVSTSRGSSRGLGGRRRIWQCRVCENLHYNILRSPNNPGDYSSAGPNLRTACRQTVMTSNPDFNTHDHQHPLVSLNQNSNLR
ncbi:hypothetical protein J6590_054239 [Homalodisca vitripennis]|nr:hypothetical protein J6590_054239 [Homalodisca vitripennis]